MDARLVVVLGLGLMAACGRDEDAPAGPPPWEARADAGEAEPDPPGDPACLPYEPDTITLTGTLVRVTYPGPPRFESVEAGDRPDTGFYLDLPAPICTRARPSADMEGKRGVRRVQLVLDSAGYVASQPFLDRRVRATGTAYEWFNGHHHVPVLLQPKEIVPADP